MLVMMATLLTTCWFCYNHTSLLSFSQIHQAHLCLRAFAFPLSGKAESYVFALATVCFHLGLSFHSSSSERSSLDILHKQDYLLSLSLSCVGAGIQ